MKKNITYTTIDNKSLIVNKDLNKSIILDESGTEIWKLILEKKSKSEIIEVLSKKYPRFQKEIYSDVNEFFDLLQKYEII